ncbi:alpha/beta fold hydrolase [Halobaculum sp. MBLA0147]|uniref:alpha/beta fold hydrolase n=1 Tax=Halobaculum sp. MBLA0147 TaxID=3079934 RepID=UPI003525A648
METVSHDGRETAYEVFDHDATGPTVLCVHGSGGTRDVWRGQTRLADDHPVVTVDLSGHGDSEDVDADAGPETLGAYADDVVAVAEQTDADVLVGNSMGGAVALRVALAREYPLSGLVLAGTGPRLPVMDDLLVWLAEDFDRAVEFLHEPGRLFHDPDERSVAASRETMRATGRAVTERDFRSCHTFDVRDRLGEIAVATLALVGEHDKLTPPAYHETFHERIPDCELGVVEDAGHLAMLERPTAVNEAVRSFLDRAV